MKATDLCNAFEQEWVERYPYMRHFTVDCVVRDIAHFRGVFIKQEDFEGLVKFLTKYLKEHPNRFEYGGMRGFRVLHKAEQPQRKIQQSPN